MFPSFLLILILLPFLLRSGCLSLKYIISLSELSVDFSEILDESLLSCCGLSVVVNLRIREYLECLIDQLVLPDLSEELGLVLQIQSLVELRDVREFAAPHFDDGWSGAFKQFVEVNYRRNDFLELGIVLCIHIIDTALLDQMVRLRLRVDTDRVLDVLSDLVSHDVH